MSEIKNTQGNVVANVSDGTINTETSLKLIGNFVPDFGKYFNENFVHIMENFTFTSAPSNPIEGQVWFDSTNNKLKYYKNGVWVEIFDETEDISSLTGGPVLPSEADEGSLFWNTGDGFLYVYDDGGWQLIFPPKPDVVSKIQNFDNSIFVDTDLEPNSVVFHNNTPNLTVSNTSSTFTSNLVLNSSNTNFTNTGRYTRQQFFNAGVPSALLNSSGSNVSWNLDGAQTARVVLVGGNKTLLTPTNMKAGATYLLYVQQDEAGDRSLNFSSAYKFPNAGLPPELPTDPFSFTTIAFFCDGTTMYGMNSSNSIQQVNIDITSNTNNYNLRQTLIDSFEWNQVIPVDVVLTIHGGVVVGSTSTGAPGLHTGGSFPTGSKILIVNNGIIAGRGGQGGNGGSTGGGGSGSNGGAAFQVQNPGSGVTVTVANNGTIGGGGGGAGGGAARSYTHCYYDYPFWEGNRTLESGTGWARGGGGGGGAGRQAGPANSTAPISQAGSLTVGGNGASGETKTFNKTSTTEYSEHIVNHCGPGGSATGGTGGKGGNLGQAGSSGQSISPRSGGSGGAAGPAVVGNAFITWSPAGTRLGPLQ